MASPKFFTFDAEAQDLDEAFAEALADPRRHGALVADCIDSTHGLSQPWASRLVRLLHTLHTGDTYSPPVPAITKKKKGDR